MALSGEQEDDLQDKVRRWLDAEGYPLEFLAAHTFRENDFHVLQGYYVANEGSSPREIDVLAEFNIMVGDSLLRMCCVVECKYSRDTPWVVFSSPSARMHPAACISQTIATHAAEAILWARRGDLRLQSLATFFVPQRPGFGGRQAFKGKTDAFYSAVQSAASKASALAAEHDLFDSSALLESPELALKQALQMAALFLPVVVIDGDLFEAFYDPDAAKINVQRTDSMRIHWRGSESHLPHVTVDVVTVSHLREFAARRKGDFTAMHRPLRESLTQLKRCFSQRSLKPLEVTHGPTGMVGPPALIASLAAWQKKPRMKATKKVSSPKTPPPSAQSSAR